MTKLLSEVIRQIVELPEDRQDDAARVLMLMLAGSDECGQAFRLKADSDSDSSRTVFR